MAAPKFLALVGGAFKSLTAAIVATADSVVATGSDGKIDVSFLPAGVGTDTKIITTSEALAAGDFVNIHVATGIKARKADAATTGKTVDGFVLANVASAGAATVYLRGINSQMTGLTEGSEYFLSATVPGGVTTSAPSTTGNVVQRIGKALSATELAFADGSPAVELA